MTALAPDRLAIELRELRRKYPEPNVWAFYHPAPWAGPTELSVDGRTWRVRVGATPLAVCEAVAEAGGEDVVLLSAVDETSLPSDVVARLGRNKLQRPDAWVTLMAAFKADRMAPWLRGEHALAEALLAVAPEAGFAAAPGGVLDPDLAWDELFRYRFGLPDGRPDAQTWLAVAVDSNRASRFRDLPEGLQKALVNRARETGGPLGADLARGVLAGAGMALVAGGLLAEIAYGADSDQRDVVAATVRLEDKLHVGPKLPTIRGLEWFQAACAVESTLDAQARAAVRDLAGRWLEELGLSEHSAGSSVLETGLIARAAVLAKVLEEAAKPKGKADGLEAAWHALEAHTLTNSEPKRADRWRMAVRLVRWLKTGAPAPARDLAEAARCYASEGGWIDRAMRIVGEGEPEPRLAGALSAVLAAARVRRENENRRFAELLAGWNAAPSIDGDVLGIEVVLDKLVAPWAALGPVLLVVLDGMSMAAFEELAEDLARRDWALTLPQGPLRPIISMVPTVTTYARTSLLTGAAAAGTQSNERQAFRSHPGLRPSPALPEAALFHRADLTDPASGQLATEVRSKLENKRVKVVGVVVNTIDAQLAGSDQLALSWTLDAIQPLSALLWEARAAGRAVILTSDHGHVLDAGTAAREGSGAQRWRTADGQTSSDGEIRVAGPRVKAVTDSDAVVVAWSEAVRYGARKAGYHGGVSLPEVIVPFGVFLPRERLAREATTTELEGLGWRSVPPRQPAWWDTPVLKPEPAKPIPTVKPVDFGPLFTVAEVAAPTKPAATTWVDQLLADEQVTAAHARIPHAPELPTVKAVLELLGANVHGVTPRALAQHLDYAEARLRGLVSNVQRMLNLDGYPVVATDDATGMIKLDRELLASQYGVKLS